jgi:hypothetical protein
MITENHFLKRSQSMNEKINANCPNCEGKGEPNQRWNEKDCKYEWVAGPCRICHADFYGVYTFTDDFILGYCGKNSLNISPENQDLCTIGEDGQKYRRLLKWLWTHPPDSGQDSHGFPRGSKHTKSKTFRQLFGSVSDRKPKIPKLECLYEQRIQPLFVVEVKDLLEAWTKAIKPIKKNCRLPILHYVKLTPTLEGIELSCTDLKDWVAEFIPAYTFALQPFLLPGATIHKMLKVCNKKGVIAFGVDPAKEFEIVALHENASWKIPTLGVDSYPVHTWTEVKEERQVA